MAGRPCEVLLPKVKRTQIKGDLRCHGLLSRTGRLRPEQRDWLKHLAACGFETALWRPKDLDNIITVLAPDGPRAQLPDTF
ncbi:hypothetical protein SSP24_33340 [Streptomyces spinoverrucosus]|uniref:Uncharacterized protein n=1 Tax=Streptomyces spinoverrucosus TaxID=284043 RepID=A0A4Y3VJA9_9ACTN|nr:hypothetical protein SSP24_33340 [Streptomyces spinoverrucosus]GHB78053.1 hypothetical protein GCM10010397_55850 [Streptomyces spinoverrucosus]